MLRKSTLFKRLVPPAAFILALFILVLLCYNPALTGLPPTEKRYVAAKARISLLKEDIKKNSQREPWEKLASEFHSIYNSDPAWPNRPAALFKEAESLEELSSHSFLKSDARKAITAYEAVALKHASSQLADDALYRAAKMRAAVLKDDKGALSLLERLKRQYPKGDMYNNACTLEKILKASSQGKISTEKIDLSFSDPTVSLDKAKKVPEINVKKFSGNIPLEFKSALSRMENLKNNVQKRCWRQPWEQLRNEFLRINKASKKIASEALYYAAECQQTLAFCSKLSSDGENAIKLYESFLSTYPKHAFTEKALLQLAKMQYSNKKFKQYAIPTLNKLIKGSSRTPDAAEAKKLKSLWEKEGVTVSLVVDKIPDIKKNKNKFAEVQVISWSSRTKNSVEVVLELSGIPKYDAKILNEKKNKNILLLNLHNTKVLSEIKKGVQINGSLLKAIQVTDQKDISTIKFDLAKKATFSASLEQAPPRLILNLSSDDIKASAKKSTVQAKNNKNTAYSVQHVNNLASQLGLTVQRVFIDAGHGGNDPGAFHNSVLERNITLDIALMLGKLLKNNGLEVNFSRLKNTGVPLSRRTEMANSNNSDLFVSIHVNANNNPDINGFETYFLSLTNNKRSSEVATLENASSDKRLADLQKLLTDLMLNARINESKRLADDIQRAALFRLKKNSFTIKDNGIKSAPFHVLLGAQMPAVLVEIGYCTNKVEAKNLTNSQYRRFIAEGIAEGILAYRDRLLKNRTANNHLTGKKAGAM